MCIFTDQPGKEFVIIASVIRCLPFRRLRLKAISQCSHLSKDSSFQGAMTTEQIKNTELTSQDIVSKNMAVFAKEVPLALAKDIQGLRAIFEEVSQGITTQE